MRLLRIFYVFILFLGFSPTLLANFYAAQFGIGLHGGAGVCPSYRSSIPTELVEMEEDIEEKKKLIAKLKGDLKSVKTKRESYTKLVDLAAKGLCGMGRLKSEVCTGVVAHITEHRSNDTESWKYDSLCDKGNLKSGAVAPWQKFCEKDSAGNATSHASQWHTAVDPDAEGRIFGAQVCSEQGSTFVVDPSRGTVDKCVGYIEKLTSNSKLLRDLASEEDLNAEIEYLKHDLEIAREEKRQWMKDYESGETEAKECISCAAKVQPISVAEKIANLAFGVYAVRQGRKAYEYGVDRAADLGWPVAANPYVVASALGPMVQYGLYGALHGFGAGGCGPGGPLGMYGPGGLMGPMGMYPMTGGAFGYNPSMFPGMMPGGGMFMPGMGAWGPNGFPGMGGMGAGLGLGLGMGGFPGMGGFGGMGGGFPGMGGFGGMGGGFPGMGGFGGMGGGFPGMGGFGGMGGFPGMGGFGGPFGGMGGMMGGSPFSMQYQQQMMQMQQQQMQAYMQMQMQQQQDYYNRQQTVMQLSQQLMQIQMQIQMVSSGSYGGNFYGGGGGARAPYPNPSAPYTDYFQPGQYPPGRLPARGPGQQFPNFPGATPPFSPGY